MNLLDIIIIVTMIFFVLRGVFRGFFREISSLAGVILGIWVAALYQPQVTVFLSAFLPHGKTLSLISFALIFLVVLVFCNLLGWCLKSLFQKVFLGWFDRTLGAGLAVLKALILTYFAIFLLTFFVPSKSELLADSKLAPTVIKSYQSLINRISPDTYEELKRKFLGNKKRAGQASSGQTKGSAEKHGSR
jgi:membrane protein required for colicin V production